MLYIGFFIWITIRFTYFPRCSRAEHSPLLVRHPKLGPSGVFIIISTRVTENGLLMVSYNRARVFHLKYLTSLSSIMCSQLIPNLLTEQVWSSCIYTPFSRACHISLAPEQALETISFCSKSHETQNYNLIFLLGKMDSEWKRYYFNTKKIYIF